MIRVYIDGVETMLSYDRYSQARGHQYLTPGNTASHAFPTPLQLGQSFSLNGHTYFVPSTPKPNTTLRETPSAKGR